jgi:hypothetical protein
VIAAGEGGDELVGFHVSGEAAETIISRADTVTALMRTPPLENTG